MTRVPKELLELLAPAIAAARRVLEDMDSGDVPAKLRKVVQSSARTLPPPLARSLLAALDGDEALREKVAESLDAMAGDGAAGAVSAAFVERGPGWWATVAAALADHAAADAGRREGEARAELERLERYAAEAEARVDKARAEAAEAYSQAGERVDRARERIRELSRSDRSDVDRAAAEAEALRSQLADALEALAETRAVAASLRDRVRKMRRSRVVTEAGTSEFTPRDPAALARALDAQFDLAASNAVHVPSPPAGDTVGAVALPAGVAPDSPDALSWLLTAPAATVIVDGYNVLFRVEPAGSLTGSARRRLEETLRRLHRQSANRHAIVVVYDSTVAGERAPETVRGGVRVRFAEADRLADEEIIEIAAATAGTTIVISSDREVREAVAAAGAVTLWSEVLVPLFGA